MVEVIEEDVGMAVTTTEKTVLSETDLVALAVLKGYQESKKETGWPWRRRKQIVSVYDMTAYLTRLKSAGIDISHVAMEWGHNGRNGVRLWSRSIAKFISEAEVYGELYEASDYEIRFITDKTSEVCWRGLQYSAEEDPGIAKLISRALRILKLPKPPKLREA